MAVVMAKEVEVVEVLGAEKEAKVEPKAKADLAAERAVVDREGIAEEEELMVREAVRAMEACSGRPGRLEGRAEQLLEPGATAMEAEREAAYGSNLSNLCLSRNQSRRSQGRHRRIHHRSSSRKSQYKVCYWAALADMVVAIQVVVAGWERLERGAAIPGVVDWGAYEVEKCILGPVEEEVEALVEAWEVAMAVEAT